MITNEATENEAEKWLKPAEVAGHKGVSVAMVRSWIRRGMPHQQLGPRTVRLRISDVEGWLSNAAHAAQGGAQ